jgi:hypothetical protein
VHSPDLKLVKGHPSFIFLPGGKLVEGGMNVADESPNKRKDGGNAQ